MGATLLPCWPTLVVMPTDLLDPMTRLRPGSRLRGTQYVVVRRIGGGGMGAVFEIEHGPLKKRLIAKTLQPGLRSRSDLRARMNTEARTLARIGHRHIVEVYDLGVTTDGIPFFVMEKLEGKNLRRVLHDRRRLDLDDALTIACEILEGLGHAHREGVVHRDIKPENLFLARAGAGVIAKILDFGIAKVVDETGEITGARFIGTPHYASPEQLCGDAATEKSDIYSVGCVLFELLTGRRPFAGPTARDFMLQHAHERAPRITRHVAIPADLDKLVARMLEKDPRKRPVNASWLSGELDRIRRAESNSFVEAITTKEMLRSALESRSALAATPVAPEEAPPEETPIQTPCVTTGIVSDAHTPVVTPAARAASGESRVEASADAIELSSTVLPRMRWVRWFAAVMLLSGACLSLTILFCVREASGRDAMPLSVPRAVPSIVLVPLAPATSTATVGEAEAPEPTQAQGPKIELPARAASSARRPAGRPSPPPHPVPSGESSARPPPPEDDDWIRSL